MKTPPWIGKAQRWLDENAKRIFAVWLDTKNGQQWKRKQNRRRIRYLGGPAPNSPYAFGFALPDYHYDLIEAVGRGDEETAKAIMLYEGSEYK